MRKPILSSLVVTSLLIGATGCGAAEGDDQSIESRSEAILAGNVALGSYNNGKFYFDANMDGIFNATDVTLPPGAHQFGVGSDVPLAGYGSGHTCGQATGSLGVFRPTTAEYFLDMNANVIWDAGDKYLTPFSVFLPSAYALFPFIWTIKVGATCRGVVGIAVQISQGSPLLWFADINDDGVYAGSGPETLGVFGSGSQLPMPIWSAAMNSSVMATFDVSNGAWYVDTNNNKTFDGCSTDSCTNFGGSSDFPFTNSGSTKRGVHTFGGSFYIDGNANGLWNGSPADGAYAWRSTDVWGFIWGG